jgi:hypothetical protein
MTRKNNAQSNVAKRNAKTNVTPSIVLKTIHDDIMKDNAQSTLTTKKMRVKLRATPATRAIHVANASWIFTQSQYDIVRSMFDERYAQRIARANKRATSSRKRDAQTNVDATNDANAE